LRIERGDDIANEQSKAAQQFGEIPPEGVMRASGNSRARAAPRCDLSGEDVEPGTGSSPHCAIRSETNSGLPDPVGKVPAQGRNGSEFNRIQLGASSFSVRYLPRCALPWVIMMKILVLSFSLMILLSPVGSAQSGAQDMPVPSDVKPGSITCEECPYPYPSSYLPLTLYGQDVRMAYMDVTPQGQANGHTVVLLHGNNFAGFYFGVVIDALRKEGFRVIVPDQIGYGRSSKPIIPYYLADMARNTRSILQRLNINKAMIVGHSMGGMLAARFASQYPDATERLVLFNPIGLTDTRFNNPVGDPDEAYKRTLASTYQTIRASLMRYVAHKPSAWNSQFESYVRIRYAWTLSADWPRLARVQSLMNNLISLDPVVYDWAHIQAPTLVYGGAEDMLAGTPAAFQEGMKRIAATIPNGKARLELLPGLGHVPFMEAPERALPPLVAFLKEGLTK
jgi:pimeloyl-ACP methyl ester carboxylesterase